MKKILNYLVIAALAVLVAFTSCKKNEDKVDVYVVGNEFSGELYTNSNGYEERYSIAVLWKNGIAQNLTDRTHNAMANSVFVSGSDVYVVGIEGIFPNTAVLWKNGIAQKLSDGTTHVQARSVFVSGNDVYVAGRESAQNGGRAVLWKNGIKHYLSNNWSAANYVHVYDENIFVAGYEYRNAVLWKNGVAQYLTDGTDEVWATSVYVSDGDVYVTGKNWNTNRSHAILWKNGIEQYLSYFRSEAYSVYVSGVDVYVAGGAYNVITTGNITGNILSAVLWKNDIAQNLTEKTCFSGASSIFVSGNNVYVAGYKDNAADRDSRSFATLWKNGVAQLLTDGTYHAVASSVFVVEK